MHMFNFIEYNKDEEKIGGDYWKFVDTSNETLLKNNIYLPNVCKIIKQISNKNLRAKMKQKLFDLIMEDGIFYGGIESGLDIFNSDELKKF